jgi:hypothetical protein
MFSCVFLLALSLPASASDYQSPRTAALGGAGHASPLLTDAIFLNPAMGAFLPAYSISASHNGFSGPDSSEPKGRVLHGSILDGSNPAFQAGVGYSRETYGRVVNVAASTKVAPQIAVGLGGKVFFGSDSRNRTQDAMVSALGQPLEGLQVGVTLDNLLASNSSKIWGRYREATLGLRYTFEKILYVYADPHYVFDSVTKSVGYEAGIEIPIMTDLFIRGGMNRNSFQPHLMTYGKGFGFGAGWIFPRLSLDFAISKTTEPIETKSILFSFTII